MQDTKGISGSGQAGIGSPSPGSAVPAEAAPGKGSSTGAPDSCVYWKATVCDSEVEVVADFDNRTLNISVDGEIQLRVKRDNRRGSKWRAHCPVCDGSGDPDCIKNGDFKHCPSCHGTGEVEVRLVGVG
jgi:hypothetical protein